MRLEVTFTELDERFEADFDDKPRYQGEVVVTPAREAQTLATAGKLMKEDVVVEAIPQEYGLVSYDQNRMLTIK